MIDNNFFLEEDEDGFTLDDSITYWFGATGSKKLIFIRPVGKSEIQYACSVPNISKGDQLLLQRKYPTYSDEEGIWVTLIEYENDEDKEKIFDLINKINN